MLKLRETGILQNIMDKTWPQHSREILIEVPPSVTLEMVMTIHLLFVTGVLLSVVILCVEYMIWRGGWCTERSEDGNRYTTCATRRRNVRLKIGNFRAPKMSWKLTEE
jgi:hypothetical protein